MLEGTRLRIMLAALVFALGWALGVAVYSVAHISLAIFCLGIGSAALAYLVWEYHRALRLRPFGPSPQSSVSFRNWSGVSVCGFKIRPENITAVLAFLICLIGIYEFVQLTSRSSMLTIPKSPPLILLPESKPLQ